MKDLRSDDGAVSIFVVVTLVLVFGVALLVIDAGVLYQERRELQNAADSAALAAAMACAEDRCYEAQTVAEDYAASNMSDGLVTTVAVIDSTASTVDVTTTSDAPIAPIFGGILGVSDGTTVTASAGASWEWVEEYEVLPLILSECEVSAAFGSADPTTNVQTGNILFLFHTSSSGSTLATAPQCYGQAGQDTSGTNTVPGGFGWLDNDACFTLAGPDAWLGARPGASVPSGCDVELSVGTTYWIAVFDGLATKECRDELGPKCYHIGGFVGLEVTGFRFQDLAQNAPCSPPDTCVSGKLLQYGATPPDPAYVVGSENLAGPRSNLLR